MLLFPFLSDPCSEYGILFFPSCCVPPRIHPRSSIPGYSRSLTTGQVETIQHDWRKGWEVGFTLILSLCLKIRGPAPGQSTGLVLGELGSLPWDFWSWFKLCVCGGGCLSHILQNHQGSSKWWVCRGDIRSLGFPSHVLAWIVSARPVQRAGLWYRRGIGRDAVWEMPTLELFPHQSPPLWDR